MKKINYIILVFLMVVGFSSCEEFETPVPALEKFSVYNIGTDNSGNPMRGDEIGLSSVPANTTVRLEVITEADMAVFWPGDYTERAWGTTGTMLDSRNYEHYGQLGAQGLKTSANNDQTGYFKDYSWPETGTFTAVVVLTNHGTDGPEFEQKTFEFTVNVVE